MQCRPLAEVADQHVYRQRSTDDVELVVIDQNDGEHARCYRRLISQRTRDLAKIRFQNTSQCHVRPLWIDFEGHEVAYSSLKPGEAKLYSTYTHHCWICRDLLTGKRMNLDCAQVVIAQARQQSVQICCPPTLPWAVDSSQIWHKAVSRHAQTFNYNLCKFRSAKRHKADDTASHRMTPCRRPAIAFGDLPMHIVKDIIGLSAPQDIWQDAGQTEGCPDVNPPMFALTA